MDDKNTNRYNQFFELIKSKDKQRFHSIEEEEALQEFIDTTYQNMYQMVKLIFSDIEITADNQTHYLNLIQDALQHYFLITLDTNDAKDSPIDSGRNIDHLEESKFETVLTTINQLARS